MSYFDQNTATARRAAASRMSAADPFLSARASLTTSLIIVCAAAHIFLTTTNVTSDTVQLSAAHPDLVSLALESSDVATPIVRSPVVKSSVVESPVVASPVVASPKVSSWKNRHLDNRHYASTSSLANSSELDYLCIERATCGWFVNLVDETNCNKSTKGREFRVRLESDQVVRDFQSRCVGYGLVFVGTESGEEQVITRMVKGSDTLKANSVSQAGIIKTQKFDSRGSSSALDIAVRAAGLHTDLKVSDNVHR